MMRPARAAFVVLTRVPLGGHPYTLSEWTWATGYFPLVGLVLGAALATVSMLAAPLGPLAGATLVVAASLLLTGALHEDGLADTSDALGGAFDRDRVLEILKDSRIGTFGSCAIAISVVGRIALLAQLGRNALWALPIVGCAARVAPVWQMITLAHASPANAKSRPLLGARWPQATLASAWFVAVAGVAAAYHAFSIGRMVALATVLSAITVFTGWRYARRVGGFTGDFLGATEQACELAGYAVLAWGAA